MDTLWWQLVGLKAIFILFPFLSSLASVRPNGCNTPSSFPTATQALGVSQTGKNSFGFYRQCCLPGI